MSSRRCSIHARLAAWLAVPLALAFLLPACKPRESGGQPACSGLSREGFDLSLLAG